MGRSNVEEDASQLETILNICVVCNNKLLRNCMKNFRSYLLTVFKNNFFFKKKNMFTNKKIGKISDLKKIKSKVFFENIFWLFSIDFTYFHLFFENCFKK